MKLESGISPKHPNLTNPLTLLTSTAKIDAFRCEVHHSRRTQAFGTEMYGIFGRVQA